MSNIVTLTDLRDKNIKQIKKSASEYIKKKALCVDSDVISTMLDEKLLDQSEIQEMVNEIATTTSSFGTCLSQELVLQNRAQQVLVNNLTEFIGDQNTEIELLQNENKVLTSKIEETSSPERVVEMLNLARALTPIKSVYDNKSIQIESLRVVARKKRTC